MGAELGCARVRADGYTNPLAEPVDFPLPLDRLADELD